MKKSYRELIMCIINMIHIISSRYKKIKSYIFSCGTFTFLYPAVDSFFASQILSANIGWGE